MDNNTIIASPAVTNSGVEDLWHHRFPESKIGFYDFITTPTMEREIFLAELGSRIKRNFKDDCMITEIC